MLTSAAWVSWCSKVRPVKSSRKECEELKTLARKLKPSRSYWSRTCQTNKQRSISDRTPINLIHPRTGLTKIKAESFWTLRRWQRTEQSFPPTHFPQRGKAGSKREEKRGLIFPALNTFFKLLMRQMTGARRKTWLQSHERSIGVPQSTVKACSSGSEGENHAGTAWKNSSSWCPSPTSSSLQRSVVLRLLYLALFFCFNFPQFIFYLDNLTGSYRNCEVLVYVPLEPWAVLFQL